MITEMPTFQTAAITARRTADATSIRCLVVDDHPAVRLGLRELLAVEPGIEVLGALPSAAAVVAFAEREAIDVAVLDYQLGGRSGLWCSRKLKRLPDPPAVLVHSAFSDYLLAAGCVVARVDGLVSKAALGSELCERGPRRVRGHFRSGRAVVEGATSLRPLGTSPSCGWPPGQDGGRTPLPRPVACPNLLGYQPEGGSNERSARSPSVTAGQRQQSGRRGGHTDPLLVGR